MSLARDVTTVGGATLLSRLLGFVRDVVIAAVLGAGALADAFFIALQIPNLFRRLLAEGALNSAFVPLWLRRRQEDGDRAARRFSEDVLGTLGVALAAIAVLCALFAPAVVALLAPGFAAEPYLFAVYFLRLAAPYLADRRPGRGDGGDTERRRPGRRGRLRPGGVQRGDDRGRRGHCHRRARQLAAGGRDPGGRDRGRGTFPIDRGRRCDVPARRSAACAAAQRFKRCPPLLPDDAAGRDRRRHSAAHSDRRHHRGIVVAVRGVVADLFVPALRAAARRRVDRYRFGDDAGDRRACPRRRPRFVSERAIARLRDRARPCVAGGGRARAAGRTDRDRPVRARRLQRARHRRGRRRRGGHCARHSRACAGEGAGLGVVRA